MVNKEAPKPPPTASATSRTPSSPTSSPSSPPRTAPAPRSSRPGCATSGAPPPSTSTATASLASPTVYPLMTMPSLPSSLASSPPTRAPAAASASPCTTSAPDRLKSTPGSPPLPLTASASSSSATSISMRKQIRCRYRHPRSASHPPYVSPPSENATSLILLPRPFTSPQLKQLALEDVVVSETSLHSMIAGCPALECLLIHGILGVRCIRINSLTLRSFGVCVGPEPADELQLEELIIEDAPCLERLHRLDLFDGLHLSATSAPKLQTIGYLSNQRVFSRSLMFGSAKVIQGLHLDRLTAVVCTVKILAADLFMLDLDTVIELMRCFPCLEKLYIESVPGGKNLWRRKHRDLIKCFDIRLKTIGLGFYRGIKSEVDFVTFFVLNAKVLELMIVHVSPQDYYRGFVAEQSRKLKFENRASKGARIHFTTDRCLRGVSEINRVHDLDLTDPFISRCQH